MSLHGYFSFIGRMIPNSLLIKLLDICIKTRERERERERERGRERMSGREDTIVNIDTTVKENAKGK